MSKTVPLAHYTQPALCRNALHLSQINTLLVCIYYPPNLTITTGSSFLDIISTFIDSHLLRYPSSQIYAATSINLALLLCKLTTPLYNLSPLLLAAALLWIRSLSTPTYLILPPLGSSNHSVVSLCCINPHTFSFTQQKQVFDFWASNINSFITTLDKANYSPILSSSNVNEQCQNFKYYPQQCFNHRSCYNCHSHFTWQTMDHPTDQILN